MVKRLICTETLRLATRRGCGLEQRTPGTQRQSAELRGTAKEDRPKSLEARKVCLSQQVVVKMERGEENKAAGGRGRVGRNKQGQGQGRAQKHRRHDGVGDRIAIQVRIASGGTDPNLGGAIAVVVSGCRVTTGFASCVAVTRKGTAASTSSQSAWQYFETPEEAHEGRLGSERWS